MSEREYGMTGRGRALLGGIFGRIHRVSPGRYPALEAGLSRIAKGDSVQHPEEFLDDFHRLLRCAEDEADMRVRKQRMYPWRPA